MEGVNTFTPHIPGFIDVEDAIRAPVDFNSMDELLAIPAMQRFAHSPEHNRFALHGNSILSVATSGNSWRVVGFLKDATTVDLPHFTIPDRKRK